MDDITAKSDNLGIWGSLKQLIAVLGFHDMASFFATSIFLVFAVGFIVSGALFLVKKRRERMAQLLKIVHEVQNEKKLIDVVEKDKKPITPAALIDTEVVLDEKEVQSEVKSPQKKIEDDEPKTELIKPVEKKPQELPVVVAITEPDTKSDTRKELGAALKNTRGGFLEKLSRLWSRGPLVSDADFLVMEEILFTADIGAKTAQKLLDVMRERVKKETSADATVLRSVLKEEMCRILESVKSPRHDDDAASLRVVMLVGVNGAGKTTSIAKLGAKYKTEGKTVLFGAGDTFRAAAVEQLKVWGSRVGAEVVSGKENSDSAAVLFEAIEQAKKTQMDYVLCDTAGRLHTKLSLMDELKKVHRVMGKAAVGAPHEVLLVIDATMGQNAINQAREFALVAPLTGVVLSKLDGTAKGGVAIGIVDELKVPIRYIGIGEKMNDLKDFDAKMFVDALFDEV